MEIAGASAAIIITALYIVHAARIYFDNHHKDKMHALGKIERHLAEQRQSLYILQQDTREIRKVDEEVRLAVVIRTMAEKLGVDMPE